MLRALPPHALGSNTVTANPRSASSWATARPAMPPPRTATRLPGLAAKAGAGRPSAAVPAITPPALSTVLRSTDGFSGAFGVDLGPTTYSFVPARQQGLSVTLGL